MPEQTQSHTGKKLIGAEEIKIPLVDKLTIFHFAIFSELAVSVDVRNTKHFRRTLKMPADRLSLTCDKATHMQMYMPRLMERGNHCC
jgi:hypothetical protein